MRRPSIRTSAVVLIATAAVAIVSVCVSTSLLIRERVRSQALLDLQILAVTAANSLSDAGATSLRTTGDRGFWTLQGYQFRYFRYDLTGTSKSPDRIDPFTRRLLSYVSDYAAPGFYYDDEHKETYLYSIVDLSVEDDGQFLVVTRTSDATRQVVGTFVALAGAMGTLAIVVIVMVGLTIVRRAQDSQIAVHEAARAYAAGNLSFRVHTAGTSAESALVDEINAMAEALESRFAGIRDDREDLEAILSSMIEGVIVLNPDRTIRRINGAAARLFKVSAAGSVGRTVLECLRNAQVDEIASLTLETDEPVERPLTLYGEQTAHLQLHATRLAGGTTAETTGIVVVTSDVTRLQQLEKIRRDFVANVSHELRTPITSIKGFVETLQDGVLDDREQSERFIEIILRHTNRLNLIIEDLLTLSRLEQPDSELLLGVHSIRPTIDAVVDVCQSQAEARNITIRSSVAGTDTVRFNPTLLEQALVNLVDNAVKYSAEGTTVEIRVRSDEAIVRVDVIDQGQGISPEDLPRIFERFYRTDKARSRALGGTGLGLAIVKHIARAHGGDVTASSEIGRGSTFSLSIPQVRANSVVPNDRPAEA